MRLRQVEIKNFRILRDVSFPVRDRTLIVGENDAGKTAIIDALRIALGRGPFGRQSPFEESDYHLEKPSQAPEDSPGIEITLWFREDHPGEWPEAIKLVLQEIDQTHPVSGLDSIGLRLSSSVNKESGEPEVAWEFLDLQGEPLKGAGASPVWLSRFLNYLAFQHLSALRDPQHEFSIRSRTWGRILRQMNLSPEVRAKIEKAVKDLNDLIVGSDPRFDRLVGSLGKVDHVVSLHETDPVSIRAAPAEPWELLARSELAIRSRGAPVQIPLLKHGLGLQSLAVVFLLESYIDLALRQEFRPETEALVAIEEPEAHLHPQAALAFAKYLETQTFQMILTTHSPYFFTTIPIENVIFLRSTGAYSEVRFIPRSYDCHWPTSHGIVSMCAGQQDRWTYDGVRGVLNLRGTMSEQELKNIQALAPGDAAAQAEIQRVFEHSQSYLTNEELTKLSQWAARVRGHIFFARSWLLCEGPSDLIILQGMADFLNKPFDSRGVTVIDYRNNGTAGAFVALARNLGIPWVLTCDGDPSGLAYAEEARKRGFGQSDLAQCVRPLQPDGTVLEAALVRSRLKKTVIQTAQALGFSTSEGPETNEFEAQLISYIHTRAELFAVELCKQLRIQGNSPEDIPPYFSEVIDLAIALAG